MEQEVPLSSEEETSSCPPVKKRKIDEEAGGETSQKQPEQDKETSDLIDVVASDLHLISNKNIPATDVEAYIMQEAAKKFGDSPTFPRPATSQPPPPPPPPPTPEEENPESDSEGISDAMSKLIDSIPELPYFDNEETEESSGNLQPPTPSASSLSNGGWGEGGDRNVGGGGREEGGDWGVGGGGRGEGGDRNVGGVSSSSQSEVPTTSFFTNGTSGTRGGEWGGAQERGGGRRDRNVGGGGERGGDRNMGETSSSNQSEVPTTPFFANRTSGAREREWDGAQEEIGVQERSQAQEGSGVGEGAPGPSQNEATPANSNAPPHTIGGWGMNASAASRGKDQDSAQAFLEREDDDGCVTPNVFPFKNRRRRGAGLRPDLRLRGQSLLARFMLQRANGTFGALTIPPPQVPEQRNAGGYMREAPPYQNLPPPFPQVPNPSRMVGTLQGVPIQALPPFPHANVAFGSAVGFGEGVRPPANSLVWDVRAAHLGMPPFPMARREGGVLDEASLCVVQRHPTMRGGGGVLPGISSGLPGIPTPANEEGSNRGSPSHTYSSPVKRGNMGGASQSNPVASGNGRPGEEGMRTPSRTFPAPASEVMGGASHNYNSPAPMAARAGEMVPRRTHSLPTEVMTGNLGGASLSSNPSGYSRASHGSGSMGGVSQGSGSVGGASHCSDDSACVVINNSRMGEAVRGSLSLSSLLNMASTNESSPNPFGNMTDEAFSKTLESGTFDSGGSMCRKQCIIATVISLPVSNSKINADGMENGGRPTTGMKRIRYRLFLLLHSFSCTVESPGSPAVCSITLCRNTKHVFSHIATCNDKFNCQNAFCKICRMVIMHWNNCDSRECGVCVPFKSATLRPVLEVVGLERAYKLPYPFPTTRPTVPVQPFSSPRRNDADVRSSSQGAQNYTAPHNSSMSSSTQNPGHFSASDFTHSQNPGPSTASFQNPGSSTASFQNPGPSTASGPMPALNAAMPAAHSFQNPGPSSAMNSTVPTRPTSLTLLPCTVSFQNPGPSSALDSVARPYQNLGPMNYVPTHSFQCPIPSLPVNSTPARTVQYFGQNSASFQSQGSASLIPGLQGSAHSQNSASSTQNPAPSSALLGLSAAVQDPALSAAVQDSPSSILQDLGLSGAIQDPISSSEPVLSSVAQSPTFASILHDLGLSAAIQDPIPTAKPVVSAAVQSSTSSSVLQDPLFPATVQDTISSSDPAAVLTSNLTSVVQDSAPSAAVQDPKPSLALKEDQILSSSRLEPMLTVVTTLSSGYQDPIMSPRSEPVKSKRATSEFGPSAAFRMQPLLIPATPVSARLQNPDLHADPMLSAAIPLPSMFQDHQTPPHKFKDPPLPYDELLDAAPATPSVRPMLMGAMSPPSDFQASSPTSPNGDPMLSAAMPPSCELQTPTLFSNFQDAAAPSMDVVEQSETPLLPSIPESNPPTPVISKPKVSLQTGVTNEELAAALQPVFDQIWNQIPDSLPFQKPVDIRVPDYYDIVKNPIDLSVIRQKLEDRKYKSGWEFCDDMYLMFDNAWSYNRKTTRVYKACTKLSVLFEASIDKPMQSLGYCCGRRYMFHPQVLQCYGKPLCTIPKDASYYSYLDTSVSKSPTRFMFCLKCFRESPGNVVSVGDDPITATIIPKENFDLKENNKIVPEQMVECVHCGRKMHSVCVLHLDNIWSKGFQCETCLKTLSSARKENKFTAKNLPTTELSSIIESRVNNYLHSKSSDAGAVIVRLVSSADKILDTLGEMKKCYNGVFPEQFSYRSKAILAFQEMDGVEVCFFGMHVQEYSSESPSPNSRCVYLSYLDSVHFFQPRELRTNVYQEILIGYFDFCKLNGFETIHLWACPPHDGDYIFHCHPADQKIPKPKRLVEWYRKLLDCGRQEKVIFNYQDMFKHLSEMCASCATDIPYFEGDFWPSVIEQVIKESDQEKKPSSRATRSNSRRANRRTRGGKRLGIRTRSGRVCGTNFRRDGMVVGADEISVKVFQTVEKHKDVFFTVVLNPPSSIAGPAPKTTDPDNLIACELMDGRDAFLSMARERHWEFSSLRRAKFSTTAMLFEIHAQREDKIIYCCSNCHVTMTTKYYCDECDCDLCRGCYSNGVHPHSMEMVGLGLDLEQPPSPDDPTTPDQMKLKEQYLHCLLHATCCVNKKCKQQSCIKMKRVLKHTKECRLMLTGKWNQCTVCKNFILLCISHAKNCKADKCPIPVCARIKKNLHDQKNQRRVQANRFMQQRMAQMSSPSNPKTATKDTTTESNQATAGPPAPPTPPTCDCNKEIILLSSPQAVSAGNGGASAHDSTFPPNPISVPSPAPPTSAAGASTSLSEEERTIKRVGGGPRRRGRKKRKRGVAAKRDAKLQKVAARKETQKATPASLAAASSSSSVEPISEQPSTDSAKTDPFKMMRRKPAQQSEDSDSGDEAPMSGPPHYLSNYLSPSGSGSAGPSPRTIHVLQHGNTVYQNLVPPVDPATGRRPNISIEQEGNHIYQNFSPESEQKEEAVFQAMATSNVLQHQPSASFSHSATPGGSTASHAAPGGPVSPVYGSHCSGSLHHHSHSHGAAAYMNRQQHAGAHSSASFSQPGNFLVQTLGGHPPLFHQPMQFGGGHQQLSHFGPTIVPPCSSSSSGFGSGPAIVPPYSGSNGGGFGHHGPHGSIPRRFPLNLGPPPQYPGSGAAPGNLPIPSASPPTGAAGNIGSGSIPNPAAQLFPSNPAVGGASGSGFPDSTQQPPFGGHQQQ